MWIKCWVWSGWCGHEYWSNKNQSGNHCFHHFYNKLRLFSITTTTINLNYFIYLCVSFTSDKTFLLFSSFRRNKKHKNNTERRWWWKISYFPQPTCSRFSLSHFFFHSVQQLTLLVALATTTVSSQALNFFPL
jgi:hypothetical protein